MCQVLIEAMREKWTDDDIVNRLAKARRHLKACQDNRLEDVAFEVTALVVADVPFLLELVDKLRSGEVQ